LGVEKNAMPKPNAAAVEVEAPDQIGDLGSAACLLKARLVGGLSTEEALASAKDGNPTYALAVHLWFGMDC
jgi:hypothetical protein